MADLSSGSSAGGPSSGGSGGGISGSSSLSSSAAPSLVEIHQQIWSGSIPIELTMDESEITGYMPPSPHYIMLPRMGYLPLAASDSIAFFGYLAPESGPQRRLWFETTETKIPLKWHLPGGVLYDLLRPKGLPWKITVRFHGFPADQVLDLEGANNKEVCLRLFRNRLKQACYLQHGSSSPSMCLAKDDEINLCEAVVSQTYSRYATPAAKLIASKPQRIPLRIQIDNEPPILPCISPEPFGTSRLITVGEALRIAAPPLFTSSSSHTKEEEDSLTVTSYELSCQGLSPVPLKAPLLEVWHHLRHADMYLYMTARSITTTTTAAAVFPPIPLPPSSCPSPSTAVAVSESPSSSSSSSKPREGAPYSSSSDRGTGDKDASTTSSTLLPSSSPTPPEAGSTSAEGASSPTPPSTC